MLRQKLSDLQRIESVLAGLVARCSAVRGRVNCPLIALLQEAARRAVKQHRDRIVSFIERHLRKPQP